MPDLQGERIKIGDIASKCSSKKQFIVEERRNPVEIAADIQDMPAPPDVEAPSSVDKAGAPPPVNAAFAGARPGVAGQPPSSPYPAAASVPTQAGPEDLRFDFNEGCRILLPPRTEGRWRARLRDLDTDSILFQSENQGTLVRSTKQWFVRFGIEVWSLDEGHEPRLVMDYSYDPTDRNVMIMFPIGTLGDTMGWFSYAARFAECHPGARVTCALSGLIIPLLKDAYPNLRLVTHEEAVAEKLTDSAYATYYFGLFFDDTAYDRQPTDFRLVGLHRTAGYILGVDPREEPPRLALPDESRPIEEPYAIIAVQTTSGAKYWNNPNGWQQIVAFLKGRGYRVICIDQKEVHGDRIMWTHTPAGAENETGDRPLTERARWLRHASLFVGLASGMSWLAWAAGCPVVMISGFSHPSTEFETPYRVINWHVCNSCWNDPKLRFDHHDFLWCPRHQNTPRHFECTRLISAKQVMQVIETMPGLLPKIDRPS